MKKVTTAENRSRVMASITRKLHSPRGNLSLWNESSPWNERNVNIIIQDSIEP